MTVTEALELAVKQHLAGNLHAAEQIYRQILQVEPRQADALHLLGVIAHQAGRNDLAIEHMRAALRERPDLAAAHCNLGTVLRAIGQLDEAVACFRQAVHLNPLDAGAHNNLGGALQSQNKSADALASLEVAWRLAPTDPGVLTNLGLTLQKLGRLDEAVARHEDAIRLMPSYVEAHLNLGVARQEQGKLNEAAASYEEARRLKPDFADAHNNLGDVRRLQKRFAEAAASCERAVALKPDYAEAHNNLGSALFELNRLPEAIASLEQALRLKPDFAMAYTNLGSVFEAQGRLAEAVASFDRALAIKPDAGDCRMYRSMAWLLQGDFERGWPEYEWRPRRQVAQPPWQGEPLAGRTILLHGEQGTGDTLQFIRYAPLVKRAGAGTVLLACQAPLLRLLRGACPGVDSVNVLGETLPPFDVHAFLLSLPRLLGTTSVERIPGGVPYLHSDAELERHWRTRLEPVPAFRIGIVWQGNPAHKGDRRRSVALERFVPLSRLPGVSLISLQCGSGREQLSALPGLIDLGGEVTDFADTAAVLRSLDLVITVDTAMAHLAGALGVAAWVALPFTPDWRWLLERSDSPWYPSLRLFRQRRQGNWDDVFERIAAALVEHLQK